MDVAKDCYECSTRRESPYTFGYLPRDCCVLQARPVRKDEYKTYRLTGPVEDWWICPECRRCFGREPAQMTADGKHADFRRQP